jgi:transcriptional regulator with XRE-family HTH domain
MMELMSSREGKRARGRRRGRMLTNRTMAELRVRREEMGISQLQLARALGYSQARLWRLETERVDPTVVDFSEMASLLGMELSLGLHPIGDPIRDKGQQALGRRFDAIPAAVWQITAETLLPNPGDQRSWDRLLRLTTSSVRHLVGADLETRIRDIQALVRRTRMRERDGGVDAILIVLSDSATNRALVGQLRGALGADYRTSPRRILAALRHGTQLPGSGVILV